MKLHLCHAGDSPEDARLAGRLEKHLLAAGASVTLSDRILPGSDVQATRAEQMARARVILLLVSADFLASGSCQSDVTSALARHEAGEARVLPIIGRPCVWQKEAFARLQCLPLDGRPITEANDLEKACEDIARHLGDHTDDPSGGVGVPCPFPGLEFFDEEQAAFFFGREAEVAEALDTLGHAMPRRRWLQVDGPSGAGKSSFARAGLVPAIRRGGLRGAPASWSVAILRPGSDPVASLARAVHRALSHLSEKLDSDQVESKLRARPSALRGLLADHAPSDHGVLLLVDQLEEAFTLAGTDRSSAEQFDALLGLALADADGPLYLITTIRSDFTGRMAELPVLEKLLPTEARRYYLRAMGPGALRRAVEEPAKRAGLSWTLGLPERIVGDAAESQGALPLVAHVLFALFSVREGRTLTAIAYERLGGVGGALTRSADDLLARLGEPGRERARRLLLRLLKIGRGNEDTRQSVARDEALDAAGGDEEAERILARLSGGRDPTRSPSWGTAEPRLIVVSGDPGRERVDLVHEALIRRWDTLKKWLAEERKALELRDDVEDAARVWEAAGASLDSLPGGAILARFLGIDRAGLNERSRLFLERAEHEERRAVESERRRERDERERVEDRARLLRERNRLQRRAIRGLVAFGLLALAAVVALGRLTLRARNAEAEALQQTLLVKEKASQADIAALAERAARGEALASQAGQGPSAAALEIDVIQQSLSRGLAVPASAERGLVRALENSKEILALRGHRGPVNAIAYSADGTLVATAGHDGTVRVWSTRDGHPVFVLEGHENDVWVIAFSPDGKLLLSGGDDRVARVWDVASGRLAARLEGHGSFLCSVAFSADGSLVATASHDGTARLWRASDWTLVGALRGHTDQVYSARFSPDGRYLVTGSNDHTLRTWSTASGQTVRVFKGHEGEIGSLAISHDGRILLSGSVDRTARLWDLESGKTTRVLSGHTENVYAVAFSPQDDILVTASWDHKARLWRTRDGSLIATLVGHTMEINNVAFSPDGQHLVTTSRDHTARVWSTRDGRAVATLLGHENAVSEVAYSPDGRSILTASEDGTARLWDASEGTPSLELTGHAAPVVDVVSLASGARVASASTDGTVRVWDSDSGEELAVLRHPSPVRAVVASPDGTWMVSSTRGGSAHVWSSTGEALATLNPAHGAIHGLAISPDGEDIVTGTADGHTYLWSRRGGVPKAELRGHTDTVYTAAFSNDGARILTGGKDGIARLWDRDGNPLSILAGHAGAVETVAFSPDGTRAATAGTDNKRVMLWDTASGALVAALDGHSDSVLVLAFSPWGDSLITTSVDGTMRIWNGKTGESRRVVTAVERSWVALAITSEKDLYATAALDGTVALWDLNTDELRGTFSGYRADRGGLAFVRGGEALAFPMGERLVGVNAATPRHLVEQACRVFRAHPNTEVPAGCDSR